MNLLVATLKQAIAELAERKGVRSPRVLDKVNERGEVVIALILPKPDASVKPSSK